MKRFSKYNARKTQIGGVWFSSKAEGLHYLVLKDRLRKGEIMGLTLQPKFELVVNGYHVGTYTPDFGYVEHVGLAVVDEVKGFKARDFAIRSKLFQALHPDIELRINGKPLKQRTAKAA